MFYFTNRLNLLPNCFLWLVFYCSVNIFLFLWKLFGNFFADVMPHNFSIKINELFFHLVAFPWVVEFLRTESCQVREVHTLIHTQRLMRERKNMFIFHSAKMLPEHCCIYDFFVLKWNGMGYICIYTYMMWKCICIYLCTCKIF